MPTLPTHLAEDLVLPNRANRPAIHMTPSWLTIHDTGNPNKGADAAAHARYLKSDEAAKAPVSWHFTVDDKGAYQHLPLDEHGWHAGDGHGPGNMTSVGIEVCENVDGDRARAEDNAAALVAWLLRTLNLGIDRVVPHRRWDPAKACPHLLLPRWGPFLNEVSKKMATMESSAWDPFQELLRLKTKGLIDSEHAPEVWVTWGELATVLNRLTAK